MGKSSTMTFLTTPGGEELAIMPRREFEALQEALEAAEHARDLADYRAGRIPGLSPDETRALVSAASPLAFWRGYRGMTQRELARKAGITQNYLSEIENGKRTAGVMKIMKLAAALDLPIEAIVEDPD
ncbi:MAG: helix-turn-helix transcriptional regulator [Alphaproteobacteria bacterium]|nr:helix-turn-helix transcriptional regulator [Alphaproteobacteria bacterium]